MGASGPTQPHVAGGEMGAGGPTSLTWAGWVPGAQAYPIRRTEESTPAPAAPGGPTRKELPLLLGRWEEYKAAHRD
jgi:hypothetical protein